MCGTAAHTVLRDARSGFRSNGEVASRADSTQSLRIISVRRRAPSPHIVPISLGFVAGFGGAIVLCVKQFEHCYPYATVWATTTAGYGVGWLSPTMMSRTFPATVVPR